MSRMVFPELELTIGEEQTDKFIELEFCSTERLVALERRGATRNTRDYRADGEELEQSK